MKKIILTIILVSTFAGAEITVPKGAVVAAKTTVIQPVAVTKIEVSELRCVLPTGTNGTEAVYYVTTILTDANAGTHKQTLRMTQTEADAVMAGAGYSLADIITSASTAIQALINQRFTSINP
jgi:hypothetical protein